MENYLCEICSEGLDKMSGWMLGDIIFFLYGTNKITINTESKDNFFISIDWLEKNHLSQFAFNPEFIGLLISHASECHNQSCIEAQKRLEAIFHFFQKARTVDNLNSLVCCRNRKEGESLPAGISLPWASNLKKFFDWFWERKELWSWPEMPN